MEMEIEIARLEMWLASRAARLEARRCLCAAVGDLATERDLAAQLQEMAQDRSNLPALARHNLAMRAAVQADIDLAAEDWDAPTEQDADPDNPLTRPSHER